ncbi:MAG: LCP family protein [Chloroflexota bacterium]
MTIQSNHWKKNGNKKSSLKLAGMALLSVAALILCGGFAFSFFYHPELGNDFAVAVRQLNPELPISVLPKRENAPDWQRQERVNILLLGVDRRPNEANAPTRTDTIILASLDPGGKTVGLLSIPRDLWVDIPLKDGTIVQDRINTAYFYGDYYRQPGGGPALAMETVRRNLGVKVHYYAAIEFNGFQKMIDTLGGITVQLEKPLVDPQFPTPDYGIMSVYIPAGVQHLDGTKALWYARSRYQDADIGRMKRQQEILLAIRDRALQLGVLPKLPGLAGQLGKAVKTDLAVPEIMTLASLAQEVEPANITCRFLDMSYVTPAVTSGGAEVLLLDRQKATALVDEMFCDTRLREEDASVLVLNGTTKAGVAAKVASYLRSQEVAEVNTGNADTSSYKETVIYDCSGKEYTAKFMASALGVPLSRVKRGTACEVDVRVIIGNDAKIPQ